jgi:hypothetical protein
VQADLTPQLYIVGYTDTVGSHPDNDVLSQNRAKSISKYFLEHGFWAEIHFAGLGERALRVETGDNVDEVRNRRARYILSVQKPSPSHETPTRWTKMAGVRSQPAGFVLPPYPERWASQRKENVGSAYKPGSGKPSEAVRGSEASQGGVSEPGSGGYGGYGDQGGPPPLDEEPGATRKGCGIAEPSSRTPGWLWGWLGLVFWRRRGLQAPRA